MTVNVKPPIADLGTLALAAASAVLPGGGQLLPAAMLEDCAASLRRRPAPGDELLVAVADALGLDNASLLAAALCLAADRDPHAARALSEAQAPLGGSRPLLGFVAMALAPLGAGVSALACGRAAAAGLLAVGDEPAALAERSISIPLPVVAALAGEAGAWSNVRPLAPQPVPLPPAVIAEARARAWIMTGPAGLVLRSPASNECLAVAGHVAAALSLGLALVDGMPPSGLAPWLAAARRLPVFMPRLGPGERWPVPPLHPHAGPWLAATGLEGMIEAAAAPDEWTLPIPSEAERAALWRAGGVAAAAAARAAGAFRQGAGRIAEAATRARRAAARRGGCEADWSDVAAAVAAGAGALDGLARRSPAGVADEALVLPSGLRTSLDRLAARAGVRSTLADGLGPAAAARYRPGLRALFVGESGTGKTLAAHWLAGRLGLPLYRVDLAALTSKWIGETEKNLAAILGAAEHADVLLFFDEADGLFGARTEVGDANDRHANAQTNYLLQRIEEFDGIALLASNSRDRFDPAFTRRLDAILEFPMPDAPARRDLWCAHLGSRHDIGEAGIDRLAVRVDLAGGHIRNAVLAAAAFAAVEERPIRWTDLATAARAEYAKLGRPPPDLEP